jgi:hypothetical protein
MSLNYRIKRLDQMCRVWNLKRSHDLMAYYDVDKKIFKDFKDKKSTFSHYTVGNLKSIKFK